MPYVAVINLSEKEKAEEKERKEQKKALYEFLTNRKKCKIVKNYIIRGHKK